MIQAATSLCPDVSLEEDKAGPVSLRPFVWKRGSGVDTETLDAHNSDLRPTPFKPFGFPSFHVSVDTDVYIFKSLCPALKSPRPRRKDMGWQSFETQRFETVPSYRLKGRGDWTRFFSGKRRHFHVRPARRREVPRTGVLKPFPARRRRRCVLAPETASQVRRGGGLPLHGEIGKRDPVVPRSGPGRGEEPLGPGSRSRSQAAFREAAPRLRPSLVWPGITPGT